MLSQAITLLIISFATSRAIAVRPHREKGGEDELPVFKE
jgi:hypothetical protein